MAEASVLFTLSAALDIHPRYPAFSSLKGVYLVPGQRLLTQSARERVVAQELIQKRGTSRQAGQCHEPASDRGVPRRERGEESREAERGDGEREEGGGGEKRIKPPG